MWDQAVSDGARAVAGRAGVSGPWDAGALAASLAGGTGGSGRTPRGVGERAAARAGVLG